MCSIWNRMAAVSVVDSQFAESDFWTGHFLKFEGISKFCHGSHNSLEEKYN